MNRILLALLSLTLPLAPAAFGAIHDASLPLGERSPYQWTELTPIEAAIQNISNMPRLDSPAAVWANAWIDRLDRAARAAHPEIGIDVPRPHVLTIASDEINAASPSASVCMPIRVEVEGTLDAILIGRGQPKEVRGAKHSLVYLPVLGPFTARTTPGCPIAAIAPEKEKDFVAFFNTFAPTCQIVGKAGAWKITRASCDATVALETEVVPFIETRATTNWIVMNEGVVTSLSERLPAPRAEAAAVAVLAHELGHFYRAHSSLDLPGSADESFFYSLADFRRTGKPVAAPENSELRKAWNAGYANYASADRLSSTKSKLSPILTGWLRQVLPSLLRQSCSPIGPGACTPSCNSLTGPDSDALGAEEFSESAMTCLGSIAVKRLPVPPALDQMSTTVFRLQLTSMEKWTFGDDFDGKSLTTLPLAALLGGYFRVPGEDLVFVEPSPAGAKPPTLLDFFLNADRPISAKAKTYEEFRARVKRLGLGRYTDEEEADDISFELLERVGVPIAAARDLQFSIMEQKWDRAVKTAGEALAAARFDQTNGLDHAECLRIFAADAHSSLAAWYPTGTFADAHHSECYRAYNALVEIATHRYAGRPPLADMTAEWKLAAPTPDPPREDREFFGNPGPKSRNSDQ